MVAGGLVEPSSSFSSSAVSVLFLVAAGHLSYLQASKVVAWSAGGGLQQRRPRCRSFSPTIIGGFPRHRVGLNDSRAAAPPLLYLGRRVPLYSASKWQVPRRRCRSPAPEYLCWRRRRTEDLIAFSSFLQGPLCLFFGPLCNSLTLLGLFVLQHFTSSNISGLHPFLPFKKKIFFSFRCARMFYYSIVVRQWSVEFGHDVIWNSFSTWY
jgi:hypothetical protein